MNTVKNFTATNLWLNQIDVLEFVIKYVLNKAEGLNLNVFNMITGINKSKTSIKHISCACKCRFNGKNVVQINGGITINVDVGVKNNMYVKKIIFGILLHVIAKMENIAQVLWMIQ